MCFYFFRMFVVEVESLCLRLIEKISINTERKLLLFYILLFFVVLEVRYEGMLNFFIGYNKLNRCMK